jgi:hypothetical protein
MPVGNVAIGCRRIHDATGGLRQLSLGVPHSGETGICPRSRQNVRVSREHAGASEGMPPYAVRWNG